MVPCNSRIFQPYNISINHSRKLLCESGHIPATIDTYPCAAACHQVWSALHFRPAELDGGSPSPWRKYHNVVVVEQLVSREGHANAGACNYTFCCVMKWASANLCAVCSFESVFLRKEWCPTHRKSTFEYEAPNVRLVLVLSSEPSVSSRSYIFAAGSI